jgi:hypothetical protein
MLFMCNEAVSITHRFTTTMIVLLLSSTKSVSTVNATDAGCQTRVMFSRPTNENYMSEILLDGNKLSFNHGK